MMQRVVVAKTNPYFFSPKSASYAESKSYIFTRIIVHVRFGFLKTYQI